MKNEIIYLKDFFPVLGQDGKNVHAGLDCVKKWLHMMMEE